MKNIIITFLVSLLCIDCSKSFSQINSDSLLTGLALPIYQNSPPGIAGFYESIDTSASIGVNMMFWSDDWSSLEPSANNYSLQNSPINPLKYLDTTGTKIKSFIYRINMINSNLKTTPTDLQALSFGDPQMISRFSELIDTLSMADSAISRITHILIGNEVDGYLTANPSEINGFISFFQAAVNHIHLKMPTVKVGTIITFNGAQHNPSLFNSLKNYSDFIDYTYYAEGSSPFMMKPPADVCADINWMATNTGGRPFAFSEIGYTTSTNNNSSDSLQATFVSVMFDTLKFYKCNHQIEFINYQAMYDYPPGSCGSYGQGQGVPDTTALCGLMNYIGLKSWSTGQPKIAWNVFKSKLAEVNAYTCITTGASDFVKYNNQISVFPNPFSSQTTFQTSEIFKNANLVVYNLYGQAVKQISNISGQTVTLSRDNLPVGLYFIQLIEDCKIISSKNLVIID